MKRRRELKEGRRERKQCYGAHGSTLQEQQLIYVTESDERVKATLWMNPFIQIHVGICASAGKNKTQLYIRGGGQMNRSSDSEWCGICTFTDASKTYSECWPQDGNDLRFYGKRFHITYADG